MIEIYSFMYIRGTKNQSKDCLRLFRFQITDKENIVRSIHGITLNSRKFWNEYQVFKSK